VDLQRFFNLELKAGKGIIYYTERIGRTQIAATLRWLCLYMREALSVAKRSRVCVRIRLLSLFIFFYW